MIDYKLVKKLIQIHEEGRVASKRYNLNNKSYFKEHCTMSVSLGRQTGHSKAFTEFLSTGVFSYSI